MGKHGSNVSDKQTREVYRQEQRERNNPNLEDWDQGRPPAPPELSNPGADREPMTPDQAAELKDLSVETGEPYQATLNRGEAARRIAELRRRSRSPDQG